MDFGERSAKRAQVPIEQVEAVKALAGERMDCLNTIPASVSWSGFE